jgi:hypothetical protein
VETRRISEAVHNFSRSVANNLPLRASGSMSSLRSRTPKGNSTHPVRRRRLEKGDSRIAEQRLVESLDHSVAVLKPGRETRPTRRSTSPDRVVDRPI